MKKAVILMFLFCCLVPGIRPAVAHGVHVDFIIKSPYINVKAYFSKKSPLGNSDITIYSPGSDTPFQTGVSDPQGNFVFMPDKSGIWKVIADDGLGHKRNAEVVVNDSFFSDEENRLVADPHQHSQKYQEGHEHQSEAHPDHQHDHTHSEIPVSYKLIFGLSLIFGLTGIFYGLKKRKS